MDLIGWLKWKQLWYDRGRLMFGKHEVIKLGDEFGTPLYITNQDVITSRYLDLERALKKYYEKVRIHYAVKANTNPSVLRILEGLGASADCVSPGEVRFCLEAGFRPNRILYTGNNFTDAELEFALKKHVNINLDAPSQVKRLEKISKNLGPAAYNGG
ncbi:MAG: hypothetical protein ACTSRA_17135, partial [Promethearchaeota archaeon]